jgi:hypothetical protein
MAGVDESISKLETMTEDNRRFQEAMTIASMTMGTNNGQARQADKVSGS